MAQVAQQRHQLMSEPITDRTGERVSHLIREYARLRGRTNTEVAYALLSSKTLKRYGYDHAQKGRLTEVQGQAAIQLLHFWIERAYEQH